MINNLLSWSWNILQETLFFQVVCYNIHFISAFFTFLRRTDLSPNTSLPRVRGITYTSSLEAACVCTNLGP